ncbi:MAG: mannonate dehydratase [Bacteroidales bacterium]|nr:mannonate dehydratase [Bacteroidales bacterium]MBN2818679.1 mannonate dehydratase [Bacteroidales bacterium]
MGMEQTWRWYGPSDPVTLADIRQAGATGIVTALHDVPIGEVWTEKALTDRKRHIEWDDSTKPGKPRGLTWSVIESIPVHEDIKQGKPTRDEWIEKYKESIRNVGKVGIPVVTYNWMPVVDWTRTNLQMELEDGARALSFNFPEFVAFDLFMLEREGAEKEYSDELVQAAKIRFESMSSEERYVLQKNIIAGLPGGQEGYDIDEFRKRLADYKHIDSNKYRVNLKYFLEAIVPVAIESGVRLAIHPDDPPISLFGLPRVVSTEKDLQYIVNLHDSIYNGLCICTGSLGVRPDNDLPGIIERLGDKVNFLHLRSTQRDPFGSFHEASHLRGDVDMYNVMVSVLKEQKRRHAANRQDEQIPMRADHGHTILDDLKKKTNPGYSAIGLLRGMAELRGLELGIEKSGVIYRT